MSSVYFTVHPHVCGERLRRNPISSVNFGSSPRLWGTDWRIGARTRQIRFIPTSVGNGISVRSDRSRKTVHPHVCGERLGAVFLSPRASGSSPRLWGTGHKAQGVHVSIRFIPTSVGNGSVATLMSGALSVHPHVCGERASPLVLIERYVGSSPRLWGTARPGQTRRRWNRFIPTSVGNGVAWMWSCAMGPVHPHVCGERNHACRQLLGSGGSSPRLWGTGASPLAVLACHRFIPTSVGNGRFECVAV